MPTFVHPALLWGLGLAALPVLIHLINMLRHRRVEWAAMEFLLTSQKKNRTWVLLKQLLLLLLRMAALAAVVLMLAQPLLRNELGRLFGGTKTHHIVLVDDSFSMSDRWADTSAIGRAKTVVERIAAEAARQAQPQQFTLLRFSRAADGADVLQEPVDKEFPKRIGKLLAEMEPSRTAAGPLDALGAMEQMLGESEDEQRIVYLITDFRARQWDEPTELKKRLTRLNDQGARLHLVNCVDAARPNLAVVGLRAVGGTRAAGVPLFVEVTVRNFGAAPARDVAVLLEEDDHARPAVTIDEIPAGRAASTRFLVQFSTAGEHRLTARLDSDAVEADNARFLVLDLPLDVPVLLVDGAPEALDARFLGAALSPGGPARTGINPRVETPRFLSTQPLEPFQTIYLANVDRLERSAVEALEKYVAAGGGLAIFLGERSQTVFLNETLYRDGQGLMPLPLDGPAELVPDRLDKTPDVEVSDHPLFRILSGQRNSFLATILVRRYFAAPRGWKPDDDSPVRVIARLRGGMPLVVEKPFGRGRVVAFLTTAAPLWNNWGRGNPSYVVTVQELQAYLGRPPARDADRLVGAPLVLRLDPARYQPQVRFVAPVAERSPRPATDAVPQPDGSLVASLDETPVHGVYEARLTKTDGSGQTRRFAVNVSPEEGDLKTIAGEALAMRLDGVRYEYKQAEVFQYDGELAGFNLGEALLYLLIVLLVGEQILAYAATYHPPLRAGAAGRGGSP